MPSVPLRPRFKPKAGIPVLNGQELLLLLLDLPNARTARKGVCRELTHAGWTADSRCGTRARTRGRCGSRPLGATREVGGLRDSASRRPQTKPVS